MTDSSAKPAARQSRSQVSWHLTAIAFADIAGFTHLMAADEFGTVQMWGQVQDEVVAPTVERYHGRLVESAGDSVLVEFGSAVQAVKWAIEVQRVMSTDAYVGSGGEPLRLRIGVNVDDTIEEEGTLFSSGVNIASRIHDVAQPGEIVVTEIVRQLVGNRAPAGYRDLGVPRLKNIAKPVQVFAVEPDAEKPGEVSAGPYLRWNSRPTLAVLPFRMIGGTEEDRYFGEGITEDIITGVSRSRALYVIARNSTLRFQGNEQDPQAVAKSLGVKYLLTGSVRRRNERLRIHAELMQAEENRTIWAERYEGGSNDVFAFQDRIAASIVSALEPNVRAAEMSHLNTRSTDSLDAYDCLLKALSLLYKFTSDSYAETEKLLARAIRLDPHYSQAHAYQAWRLNFWIGEGHSPAVEEDTEAAIYAAQRAIELDSHDAFALAVRGHVASFLERNPRVGVQFLDEALRIDQNLAIGWCLSAATHAYLGNGDEARERMQNVWQLSPYDELNFFYCVVAGISDFTAERYEEAAAWMRNANRANPRFVASLRMLAATLAILGEDEEAHKIGGQLLAVDPGFRVSHFVATYPLLKNANRDTLEKGLLGAGLPA